MVITIHGRSFVKLRGTLILAVAAIVAISIISLQTNLSDLPSSLANETLSWANIITIQYRNVVIRARNQYERIIEQINQKSAAKPQKRRDRPFQSRGADDAEAISDKEDKKWSAENAKALSVFLSSQIISTSSVLVQQESKYGLECKGNLQSIKLQNFLQEPRKGMILGIGSSQNEPNSGVSKYSINPHFIPRDNPTGVVTHKYELVERIYDELGQLEEYHGDFAYLPVIKNAIVPAVRSTKMEVEIVSKRKSNVYSRKDLLTDFPFVVDNISRLDKHGHNVHRNDHRQSEREKYYERMGSSAFAGGSHGEIWKARRRCDVFSSSHSHPDSGVEISCDDKEELIMKRLRVENGMRFLEAGLREVYFGKMLLQHEHNLDGDSLHFTTYVDHFFRFADKISHSSDSQDGEQQEESNIPEELWIVFKNAGSSLRSFLYSPADAGGYLVYQNSEFWRRIRFGVGKEHNTTSNKAVVQPGPMPSPRSVSSNEWGGDLTHPTTYVDSSGSKIEDESNGMVLLRQLLHQLISSVAVLHSSGTVHRDIKPSNVMCKITSLKSQKADDRFAAPPSNPKYLNASDIESFHCVLGDFSSSWDDMTASNLYADGPSSKEHTNEYAPPETLLQDPETGQPFDLKYPQSYDSWSIGVVMLELLLGTPNVFSVDQRTTALLTHRLHKKGATGPEIKKALYLAALSQFCIYSPGNSDGWPFKRGDPLYMASMSKTECTLGDFHTALRARDPLGLGFDSTADSLLQLILRFLEWDPQRRISPAEALHHEYFTGTISNDPALSKNGDASGPTMPVPMEYVCPKCKRRFDNWSSCHVHANARRHAKFCTYDTSMLPSCLSSHPMLPAHPKSGYCDIQGRRQTIEDFHSIQLMPNYQFYGVYDGHFGNLASKFAASSLHSHLAEAFDNLDHWVLHKPQKWKEDVERILTASFQDLHEKFLQVAATSPGRVMDQSGTTATVLYITKEALILANVGDSSAVLATFSSLDGKPLAVHISVDHSPSSQEERERIIQSGGYIAKGGGIQRVNGVLAISRSIGDAGLAHVLSRRPHVITMSRGEAMEMCKPGAQTSADNIVPCFIILASDGLWDVVSHQEAIEMVIEVLEHSNHHIDWEDGGSFQEAAQRLTHEAFVRGSTDNIGVCVVAIE